METKTKQSIEEAAEQLLIWKVKGQGEHPSPFRETELCEKAIQYLVDKGYVVQTGETPKCLDYRVTPEGLEYVFMQKEDRVFIEKNHTKL